MVKRFVHVIILAAWFWISCKRFSLVFITGAIGRLVKLSTLLVMKAWVSVATLSSVRQSLILMSAKGLQMAVGFFCVFLSRGRLGWNELWVSWTSDNNLSIIHQMTPQLHIVITWYTFYHHTKFGNAMIDKSYSLNKNMISWLERKILRIYQKFHFDSKISCKPSATVQILINGMSAIFQQGLKQVLRRHCNFIASSFEVVGCGLNEPVYSGLNEPVVCVASYSDSWPNEKWIQCTTC